MDTDARTHLAWLMWCFEQGYRTPEDRAIMENWFGEHQDNATDETTRQSLLVMADEVFAELHVFQLVYLGRPDGERETHGIYTSLAKAQGAAADASIGWAMGMIDEWIDRGNGWWQSEGTPYSNLWNIFEEALDGPAIFH